MEEHYNTFITEMDFAQIAAAGLNWVRLPIPYWAIETMEGEPFLEGVCWKYILKAIEWSRKQVAPCVAPASLTKAFRYGLRMELDLHAMPGSQNGQNHSGKVGSINFLMGASPL
jgi:glucan 1,3-beta-glucosidase